MELRIAATPDVKAAMAPQSTSQRVSGFELVADQGCPMLVISLVRHLLARSPQLLYVHPDMDMRTPANLVVRGNTDLLTLADLLAHPWCGRQMPEPVLNPALPFRVAGVPRIRTRLFRDLQVLGSEHRDPLAEAIIEGWVER